MIPATGGWWLERYPELARHLGAKARPLVSEVEIGHLFDLEGGPRECEGGADWRSALETVLLEIESVHGDDPSVLDWTGELDLASWLPHRAVFTPLPSRGDGLLYVDDGADVVVLGDDSDVGKRREAERIARTAVVTVKGAESGARTIHVTWRAERESGQPLVSIVIPCNGSHGELVFDRVLGTLSRRVDCEVLAVVSGRQPAWLRSFRSLSPVRVVRSRSRSSAALYDAGAHAARGETLVLVRDDVIPLDGWLPPLLRTRRVRPEATIVGGLALSPSGCIVEAGGIVDKDGLVEQLGAGEFKIDAPPYSSLREVDFCSAGPLAVERDTFLRLGGLDSRCSDLGAALVDLCLRATGRDSTIFYQPESVSVALAESSPPTASRNGHVAADAELVKRSRRNALRRRKPARNGSSPQPSRERIVVREPPRAFVVSRRPPEPDRESGSRRVYHLIGLLRERGWDVTFGADEDYGAERGARRLRQDGIETYVPMRDRLDAILAPGRFDLALVAFWQNAELLLPRIRSACPDTRVVVDMVDLHFLREARNLLKESPARLLDQEFAFNTAREINTYALADTVLAVSGKEAELVNDLIADPRRAFVVPDLEELPPSPVRRRDRCGIVFIGNFWHPPNREALRFLFEEIVPRLDRKLLRRHPIKVIGNKLEEAIPHVDPIPEGVELVGWVPSVAPYLEQARVSVIPLRTGAGTKRKLVQALMLGTPTVSTSIGAEGIPVRDGDHVLVADDASEFAAGVEQLLRDDARWDRLHRQGRDVAVSAHGREAVASSLDVALGATLGREPRPAAGVHIELARSAVTADYSRTLEEVRKAVESVVLEGAKVYVVSRGDPELVSFAGREGRHFPEDASGAYAGHHPADGAAAVASLEASINQGAHYLVIPGSAFWWLGRYPEFQERLEAGGRVWSSERCIVYALSAAAVSSTAGAGETPGERAAEGSVAGGDDRPQEITPEIVEARRPSVLPPVLERPRSGVSVGRVLVVGIYLADRPNSVVDIAERLAEASEWKVEQRWIALGGDPPTEEIAAVTARVVGERTPKYELLNSVLAEETLNDYDYVVVTDDDIVLPERFLDYFLDLQGELDFALAQPARTSSSFIDHPIVEQQRGCLARETLFVEIGPLMSVARSAYGAIFPFDLDSPMGWGYESVWSYELADRGLKMGIIDAVPADHGLRKPVSNYSWDDADRQRNEFLAARDHTPLDRCFRVMRAIPIDRLSVGAGMK